jgi:hypothetical protein
MSLNSTQWYAYLAGFLDGDGSIYVRAKPNKSYQYDFQVAPYVAFFQSASNEKFPDMVASIRYGTLRLRKDGIQEFTITKQSEIKDFLQKVLPFLILKREQAKLMLEILSDKQKVANQIDFSRLLLKIELFRELNYSKNRKRRVTP